MPRERSRHADGRRRQRLERRHARLRARALPRRAGDRAGEPSASPRAGTAASRRPSGRYVLILNADAWLDGGLARATRRVRRLAARGGRRRPAAARIPTARCSGRCAASRPSGGSPPSTSTSASSPRARGPECVLRRRLRPRRGARGRVRDGCLHARPARRDRRGRCVSTSRSSSSARRSTGATASGGPAGRCSSSPGRECVHVGGASHGGRMFRENLRGHLRFLAKHSGARDAERARQAAAPRLPPARPASSGASEGRCTATPPAGSAPGDVSALLERTP